MKPIFTLFLVGVILVVFSCKEPLGSLLKNSPQAPLQTTDSKEVPQSLYSQYINHPFPSQDIPPKTNPPIFHFPLKGENKPGYYRLRLAQDLSFPATKTQLDSPLFALYNPHEKLAPGEWFWQYAYGEGAWSPVQSFEMTQNIRERETPSAEALIRAIPRNRPRILVYEANLFNLRKRSEGKADAQKILNRAERMLSQAPPKESLGIPSRGATSTAQREILAQAASKELGEAVKAGIDPLVKAYVLTGERRYGQAALRWAMEITKWDTEGVSAIHEIADGECMYQMAQVFDACYNLITVPDRNRLLQNIRRRAMRFHAKWTHDLESKVYSSHEWQYLLEQMIKTAIATIDEIPEAELWLSFAYELWLARSPILGPEDGGWWNGVHDLGAHSHALLEIPLIFKSLTGVDFFTDPFYEFNPDWLMYTLPAHSFNEDFGHETKQLLAIIGYADALSRIKNHPYAAWYADQHLKTLNVPLEEDENFRWFRLRWDLPSPPKLPTSPGIPLAKVFPETGIAYFHTDLLQPESNLMVSFRSSPFGSISHAPADQNSFNMQYGGQALFYNYAYPSSPDDLHSLQGFRETKGHNSLLIDGKGQPNGSGESYGWIARFLNGDQISYALGDASKAYDNLQDEPQYTGLETFRRHLILLRPATLIIYDELEADHVADWDWLLHSMKDSQIDPAKGQIDCVNSLASARVNLYGSVPLDLSIKKAFQPEPANTGRILNTPEESNELGDRWQIKAKTRGEKLRYLAVIQVRDKSNPIPFSNLPPKYDGSLALEDWTLEAELNPELSPSFSCWNENTTAAISFNRPGIKVMGKTYRPTYQGSTLLVEKLAGEIRMKEAIDEFPNGR